VRIEGVKVIERLISSERKLDAWVTAFFSKLLICGQNGVPPLPEQEGRHSEEKKGDAETQNDRLPSQGLRGKELVLKESRTLSNSED